jgi:hypothetical protein
MTKGLGDNLFTPIASADLPDCSANLQSDSRIHSTRQVLSQPAKLDYVAALNLDLPIHGVAPGQPILSFTDAADHPSPLILDPVLRAAEPVINFDCVSENDLTVDQKNLKESLEAGLMFFGKPGPEEVPKVKGLANDAAQPGTANQPGTNVQMLLWSHLDTIAAQIPPGTTVQASDFENVFHEKGDVLRQAGLVSVKRQIGKSGDHIVLQFNDQKSTPTKDANFIHDKVVEFDFKKEGTFSELDNIKGLQVQKVLTATIEKVTLSHDQNDVTTLVGKGSWGLSRWFRLHGTKTVIVGADGKRLDSN